MPARGELRMRLQRIPPMPRGQRGAKVPASRMRSEEHEQKTETTGRFGAVLWLAGLLLVMLAINTWLMAGIQRPEERVRVPYSPVFLDQVHAGNVTSISTQESTVQGEFRREVRYPPRDRDAEPTHRFKTEVPAFADTDRLSRLLRAKDVMINAEAPEKGPSFVESLLSGLLPTLLIVGLLVWFLRRAGRGGALGGFGALPGGVDRSGRQVV